MYFHAPIVSSQTFNLLEAYLIIQRKLKEDALSLEANVVKGQTSPGVCSHMPLPPSPPTIGLGFGN